MTLSVAAVIGAIALFATTAEADGRKHRRHHNNDCYSGGRNDYGYYQRARYYERRYYYQPVRYVPARAYYQNPAFRSASCSRRKATAAVAKDVHKLFGWSLWKH